MNIIMVGGKEHIHIPGIVGNGGMVMRVGKNSYEECLESRGIYLTNSDVTSLNGETYNTKEFIIGLDSLDSYIRSQLHHYVNDGVNSNNSDSICESLISKMDENSYKECLGNVEHLKEMVDEFYEQIKNK